MNKKGFTLIEITGVVLILGVIFLMAYPTLENILKKSDKGQDNLDNENVIMAARTYINLHNSEYEFIEGGFISVSLVDMVKEGLLDNNNYSPLDIVSCKMESNNLECNVDKLKTYNNGTPIYFDPEKASVCTEAEANNNINENGTPTGIKTGCMKWYSFNDTEGSTTLNMILDHNTTPLVPFNSNKSNTEMLEAKEALDSDISTWNEQVKSTARLIKAEEIAQITGNKDFDVETTDGNGWFYLSTNSQVQGASKYEWLLNNVKGCLGYSCSMEDNNLYNLYNSSVTSYSHGYWTSSPVINSKNVWAVKLGGLGYLVATGVDQLGIRPVITISKVILEKE